MARRIAYYENAHSPPSQNSMPARHSKAQRRTPDPKKPKIMRASSECQAFQGPETNPGQEFVA